MIFADLKIGEVFTWNGETHRCEKTDEESYIHYADSKLTHKPIEHWQIVVLKQEGSF